MEKEVMWLDRKYKLEKRDISKKEKNKTGAPWSFIYPIISQNYICVFICINNSVGWILSFVKYAIRTWLVLKISIPYKFVPKAKLKITYYTGLLWFIFLPPLPTFFFFFFYKTYKTQCNFWCLKSSVLWASLHCSAL